MNKARSEGGTYKTKQRAAVEDFFDRHPNAHFTAEAVYDCLLAEGTLIGKTTVYRALDKLVENGHVRRFSADGLDSACYQHAGNDTEHCTTHFHLRCRVCGTLYHVECTHLKSLGKHLLDDHGFSVDYGQTVLYGVCKDCNEKV